MIAKALQDILRRAETWPREDQELLAEFARELEARRTGVYSLSNDERAAIERARRSAFVDQPPQKTIRAANCTNRGWFTCEFIFP